MNYSNNIKRSYQHMFFRNINLLQAVWLIYLYNVKGFTLIDIGIFETIFHISSLSMEVPTGMIADLLGRKLSRILGVLSYLIYVVLLLFFTNYFVIAIAFIFCGLSFAFESGSGEAILYDSLLEMKKEKEYMRIMGNHEVLYQLGSTISLALGGIIAMVYIELNFVFTIFFMLLALIFIILMKEVPIKREKKRFVEAFKSHFIDTVKVSLMNKRIFLLIIIFAWMLAPITTVFFFMQNYLDFQETPFYIIGLILALHAFFASMGGYFAHTLEKKFKERKILFVAPLFIALCLWAMSFGKYIFIPFGLLGFFDSLLYVVLNDYINKVTPSRVRASVLSMLGQVFSIVMIILFPIIGYIGETYSLLTAFRGVAIISSVFYILLLFILRGNHLSKGETNESNFISHNE